ncbi:MAG: mechanosensitive ion channel family protein [Alphaproteobacteria bacterium]|uniref:Mechanosensitive ion channel family protein n=1 Tax=Candidatus Nitrobium versatile TaxID=2884831 RepID=A0A953J934_9BACT|nr:mechanosensitive ion channel family protein [Candidatus Nitrobium versatile]
MDVSLSVIAPSFIIAFLVFFLTLGVRGVLFRSLHRWASGTRTDLDDILIGAIRTPSLFWCIAVGLYAGIAFSELPQKYLVLLRRGLHVMVIFSFTIATANLAGMIFKNYVRKSSLPLSTTGLAYGVFKGTILLLGILIILSFLGISIAPLVTALGVGGLAVALALQDTLSNLFAGVHILMEKSLRIGDFVRLDGGQEGYIEDITWRTTRIRTLANTMVVIPNNKLAQSIVTNYCLPEVALSLSLVVRVPSSADPERVEGLIREEAEKASREVPGMLQEPRPLVRLIPGFGDTTLDFTLTCSVRAFEDQFPVQHALRMRLLKRFRGEGMEIR